MRTLVAFGLGVLLAAGSGEVRAAASTDEVEAVAARAPEKPGAVPKTQAQAQERMKTIVGGVSRIRHLMARAQGRPFRASCVSQKLTEAKIHVQLAEDELAVFNRPEPAAATQGAGGEAAGDKEYALHRLDLLARRTSEIERTARECVEDDVSGIQVTKVEVVKSGEEVNAEPPRAILISPNR